MADCSMKWVWTSPKDMSDKKYHSESLVPGECKEINPQEPGRQQGYLWPRPQPSPPPGMLHLSFLSVYSVGASAPFSLDIYIFLIYWLWWMGKRFLPAKPFTMEKSHEHNIELVCVCVWCFRQINIAPFSKTSQHLVQEILDLSWLENETSFMFSSKASCDISNIFFPLSRIMAFLQASR